MDTDPSRLALITTYKCNWNCAYCIVDTHEKQKKSPISSYALFEKAKKVPAGSEVTLCGGEPGFLKEDQVEELLNLFKQKGCSLGLLTNGLFIKRYPQYLGQFDTVEYHCVESLEDDIEFPDLDQIKFNYLIIVTNENYDQVDGFLDRYPHIKFRIVSNSKRGEELKRYDGFKLLMKNKHRIREDSFSLLFSYNCNCEVS